MACHFRVSCSEQAAVQSAAHLKVHGPKKSEHWTGGGLYDTSRYIYIKRTSKLNQTTSLAHRHEGGRPPSKVVSPPRNCEAAYASTAMRSWSVGWGQQHSRHNSFAVDQGLVATNQGGSRSTYNLDGDRQTRPRTNKCDLGSIITSDLNWG